MDSPVTVAEESLARFKELRDDRVHRFVVFKIDDAAQRVVVDKEGARASAGLGDLTASLPADDCRYAVYDHDFTGKGESKMFFVAWSPKAARARNKLVYGSSQARFRSQLSSLMVDLQASETSELTLDVLNAHASSS